MIVELRDKRKNMKTNKLENLLLLCLFAALILSGCSFGHSSYSSSSPSRSSSRSSKGTPTKVQQTHSSYQEEVSSLAVVYAGSQQDAQSFHRELARISSRHGISDWGNDRGTFLAIGRGLKRANVAKSTIQYLSFLDDLKSLPYYGTIFSGYDER